MFKYSKLPLTIVAAFLWTASWAGAADDMIFQERQSPRPETTNNVPHIQLGVEAVPELSEELLRQVAQFPGVLLGSTRLSLAGAVGFQLERGVPLARPEAIVGGREFAHLHPDGSLHASLDPAIARAAIKAGWAVAHPWSSRRGWEGFVMIYTPLTDDELAVVLEMVRGSYTYVTGQILPQTEG